MTFDPFKSQPTPWTPFDHREPMAEELALATDGAASGKPTPKEPQRDHEVLGTSLDGELAVAEALGLHEL